MRLFFALLCLFTSYQKIFCPPAETVRLVEERAFEEESRKQDLEKKLPIQQVPPTEITSGGDQKTAATEPVTVLQGNLLPEKTGVTLSQQPATEGASKEVRVITVKSTAEKVIPEAIPTKEQTLADWNKQWSNLTKSWWGVKNSTLYKMPVEQRSQVILNFIDKMPTGFLKDPVGGLKALGDVITTVHAVLAEDPNNNTAIKEIKDAVVKRAVQVVLDGTFGKTPQEVFENLEVLVFRNDVPAAFSAIDGAVDALLQATLAKLIPIAEATPTSDWKALKDLTQKLDIKNRSESKAATPLDIQAEQIIANKAATILATERLPGNSTVQVETLVKNYFDAQNNLGISDQNLEVLQKAFLERVNRLADSTRNYLGVAEGLLSVAQKLKYRDSSDKIAFLSTIGSLLNRYPDSWLSRTSTPIDITQNYIKELEVISSYLKLIQSPDFAEYLTEQNSPLRQLFTQNAERATLLLEFLNQQKTFLPEKEKNVITQAIKKLPYAQTADPFNLAQINENFWRLYQDIKRQKLFAQEGLYALPKDLAAIGAEKLEFLRQTTDATVRANLLAELYKLREILNKPAFKEQLYTVAQFIEQVDAVDLQAFNKIDKLETGLQDTMREVARVAEGGKLSLEVGKLTELQSKLKEVSQELEKIDNTAHTNKRLLNAQKYIDAVQTIISIGQDYNQVLNPQGNASALDTVYKNSINGLSSVVSALDYRTFPSFSDRLKYMGRQQETLNVLDAILQQPLVTVKDKKYSLGELNSYLDSWFATQKLPAADVIEALEQAGLITRQTDSASNLTSLAVTERGTSLRMLAQEEAAIARRVGQLRDYVDAHKSNAQAPMWQAEFATPTAQRVAQLADTLNLTQLILDDQITALRNYYKQNLVDPNRQELYKVTEAFNKILQVQNVPEPLAESFLNKENMQDLADILEALKQHNNGQSVDKPLEIFVHYKLFKPGQTPNVEQILQMEATRDEKLALGVDTRTLSRQFSDILTEAAAEISDAYTDLSLNLQKQVMTTQQKASFWGKIGSVVAGVFGFFWGKKALGLGSGGLTTLITSGVDPLNNALGLVTGVLATGVVWKLAKGLEVSDEELKSFNKLLLEHGKDPIVKQPGWLAQARERAKAFMKNDFKKALDIVRSQKDEAQRQTDAFNSAKASLYSMLNVPATASFNELVQAIKQLDADTNIVGKTANALKKHRVQNQLNTVVTIAANLSKAYQKEILALSQVALRGIDNAAESNRGAFAKIGSALVAAGKGVFSGFSRLSSWFSENTNQVESSESQVKALDFSQANEALRSFLGRQDADLMALTSLLDSAQAQLGESTSLDPYKALQLIKDVLTGRVQSLRQEYYTNIEELLKIKGYAGAT